MAPARALMIQGTCSNAGKSLLTAGLCRLFARRGVRVLPFKPQNMSNNAAVTTDGGEIGRAQALQARACGVPPSRHMNPVLLKPEGERGAQLIVQGQLRGSLGAAAYHALKPELMPAVLESFALLRAQADLVLVEGAGSPAEVNLREGDIANMGFARAAGVPVILVGDIERGGVLAALVGTCALLEPDERALVAGYVVNKFRGDPALFDSALPILAARTGLPCLGVVPWLEATRVLPKEDILGLAELTAGPSAGTRIVVAVPKLPRLANLDDLDALAQEPEVALHVVEPGTPIPAEARLVVLPGSKATQADLAVLRREGWDIDLLAHRRRGGWILGLCGGFQMLGRAIADPQGLEGSAGTVPGLGLLDVVTELAPAKTLGLGRGTDRLFGCAVEGYEIHLGRTVGPDGEAPLLDLERGPDGAVSADGRVLGCYLHGLLGNDAFRARLLAALGAGSRHHHERAVDAALDAWADHLDRHLDIAAIEAIACRGATGSAR